MKPEDLVLADVTTKTTRRLTNTGGWVVSGDYMEDSVISPDGRQVAYTWFIEDEDQYELRVVSTATADPRPRTVVRPAKGEWIGAEAWTPDATRLVVKRELARGTWQLGIVAVSDGSVIDRRPIVVGSIGPNAGSDSHLGSFERDHATARAAQGTGTDRSRGQGNGTREDDGCGTTAGRAGSEDPSTKDLGTKDPGTKDAKTRDGERAYW